MSSSFPNGISSMKLIVSNFEQEISSASLGNNIIQITNENIKNEFNNSPVGTIFNPSISVTYNDSAFPSVIQVVTPTVIPNYIPKKITPTLSQTSTLLNKFIDDSPFLLLSDVTIISKGTGIISYASSDSNVVTINSSTGEVTIVGLGTTNITMSFAASADQLYAATTISVAITISKAIPQLSLSSPSLLKVTNDLPFLLSPDVTKTGTGIISYASSNHAVATIHSSTGEVTIQGLGITNITVSLAASTDGNWAAAGPVSTVLQVFTTLPLLALLPHNNETIKYTGNPEDENIRYSDPYFIQADPRGTGMMEWFAVVKNGIKDKMRNYFMFGDLDNSYRLPFTPPNESSPVPFNNIVTTLMTDMSSMFASGQVGTTQFNQPIGSWDTSNVTSMYNMFANAYAFNQDISKWNTSNVTDMYRMFFSSPFNKPINSWNTSKVTNMCSMFHNANPFNQPLNLWNTSNVTNMSDMFHSARSFNQPINSWNTSKVTTMDGMFANAFAFNQPLNSWKTSNVTNMMIMFLEARAFNQPINSWNTSKVTTMDGMFFSAIAFNQPLNLWNTSAVTDMRNMFYSAFVFNQDISGWNVSLVTYYSDFKTGSALINAYTPPKFS